MDNPWAIDEMRLGDGDTIAKKYGELAQKMTQTWECAIYVTAGVKPIPCSETMTADTARINHSKMMSYDDFWMSLKNHHRALCQPNDNGYPFGYVDSAWDKLGDNRRIDALCSRIEDLLESFSEVLFGMDYPWLELYGAGVCLVS